jgi:hypothetical protein
LFHGFDEPCPAVFQDEGKLIHLGDPPPLAGRPPQFDISGSHPENSTL